MLYCYFYTTINYFIITICPFYYFTCVTLIQSENLPVPNTFTVKPVIFRFRGRYCTSIAPDSGPALHCIYPSFFLFFLSFSVSVTVSVRVSISVNVRLVLVY